MKLKSKINSKPTSGIAARHFKNDSLDITSDESENEKSDAENSSGFETNEDDIYDFSEEESEWESENFENNETESESENDWNETEFESDTETDAKNVKNPTKKHQKSKKNSNKIPCPKFNSNFAKSSESMNLYKEELKVWLRSRSGNYTERENFDKYWTSQNQNIKKLLKNKRIKNIKQ